MKNLFYFSVLCLLITSCTVKEKPIFKMIDDVRVVSFSGDTVRLKANAIFENPNDVGGKISTDKMKLFVNEEEVAQVFSDEFKVPARKEFSIPLTAVVPTKKLLSGNKGGFLEGLLNSVINKSVKVQIKGKLTYKMFGYRGTYDIDTTEDVKIKF
ncbi:LEA type 2 family protein [Polaribacter sp.]|uniref:LEA type 2 family protein n=1 Tax=Polaribacter sp. TaxID=1920175 RepID=UPI003EFA9CA4